jgi:hypothetical protein
VSPHYTTEELRKLIEAEHRWIRMFGLIVFTIAFLLGLFIGANL